MALFLSSVKFCDVYDRHFGHFMTKNNLYIQNVCMKQLLVFQDFTNFVIFNSGKYAAKYILKKYSLVSIWIVFGTRRSREINV